MAARQTSVRVVTPLEITILLEAHTLVRGFDQSYHPRGSAWTDAIKRLVGEALIEARFTEGKPSPGDPLGLLPRTTYHTTKRGDFYVRHGLCAVPFPVERTEFTIPEPASAEDYGVGFKLKIDLRDDQGGAGGTD